MADFAKLASEIWRAYATDGVPASGAHKPAKADIRAWGATLEAAVGFINVVDPAGDIRLSLDGEDVFQVKDLGADGLAFGSPVRLAESHPLFRVETGGRGKLRTASIIIADPGDTPEIGVYLAMGEPGEGDYFPLPKTSVGQQGFLQYNTAYAPSDADPNSYVLANPNRLIKPNRLSGGPSFTSTIYAPSSSILTDGKAFQVKFIEGSGTAPTWNINGLGAKALKRYDGSTPASNYWVAGTEVNFTWVAGANEFRATTHTDGATGAATYRNGFMNPNWGRAVGWKTRFDQAPTETSRTMSFVVENSKPGESILRERFWVSGIGSTVIGGTGSFEDAANDHGWTAEENYPGEMLNDPLDPNYSGNYFAGLPGPHNSFNTPGWAALSIPMPSHGKWAGIGMRVSGEADVGLDIAYDHTNDWFRFDGVKPSGSSLTITSITQSPGGLCRVTTSGAHGLNRREVVRVASVAGSTEANGVWTVWPISSTVFDLLGTNFTNAYVSGGTATRANGTPTAAFKTTTQDWFFGGTPATAGLRIEPNSSGATRWKVLAGVTANPALLKAEGETNTGGIIENSGTGTLRFRTNDGDVLRLAGSTASKVNFISMDGATTSNGPTISTGGSDANVNLNINTQGTGTIALNPGGTVGLRVERVASAANYFDVTPSATGNPVQVAAGGADANIGLQILSKGDASIRFLPGGVEALRLSRISAAVNYLTIAPGTAGNSVRLLAEGSDTNRSLDLVAGGAGEVRVTKTDDGVVGALLNLYHVSVSPAGGDSVGRLLFSGKDSAGNDETYGRLQGEITTATAGSEDGKLVFQTVQAGGFTTRLQIGGGLYHGNATGLDKGNGTINFVAVYDDNVLLTDYVFDKLLGGKIARYGERTIKLYEELDQEMFKTANYKGFWREHRRLYGMPDLNDCIEDIVKSVSLGGMSQRLWQTAELHAIHIGDLDDRLQVLETELAALTSQRG